MPVVLRPFLAPTCVLSALDPSDEGLAADWRVAGVCAGEHPPSFRARLRVKVANHGSRGLSAHSLPYFEPPLCEVEVECSPEGYRRHSDFSLGRCEDYWQNQLCASAGAARPNSTPANSRFGIPALGTRCGEQVCY